MTQDTTDRPEPPATVAQMREAVGSLFMLWSRVEADLAKSLAELSGMPNPERPHGINRSLEKWKALHYEKAVDRPEHQEVIKALHAQLHRALTVRNCIAHGLEGYGVAEKDGSVGPHFRCSLKGKPEVITLEHLGDCLNGLEGAWAHISRLTHAALHPGEPGLQSLYDDVAELMRRNGADP